MARVNGNGQLRPAKELAVFGGWSKSPTTSSPISSGCRSSPWSAPSSPRITNISPPTTTRSGRSAPSRSQRPKRPSRTSRRNCPRRVTLQQLLYFNYHDATKHHRDGDAQALETKNARAIFKEYDDLRTQLRESIDLMARRVEVTIDWASNTERDAAHAGAFGGDPMSRIALGAYDFQCDDDKYMPNFDPGLRRPSGAAAIAHR